MQRDGNLVVYSAAGRPVWQTKTSGSGATVATVEQSGNLVLTTSTGVHVWSAGTYGIGVTQLAVGSDGALELESAGDLPLWRDGARTGQAVDSLRVGAHLHLGEGLVSLNGGATAMLESDGDLVVSRGSDQLWDTKTEGDGVTGLDLEADGTIVLHRANGSVAWHSSSPTSVDDRLVLTEGGTLELVTPGAIVLWAQGARTGNQENLLSAGHSLARGQGLVALSGSYTALFQEDGNLVAYGPFANPLWSTGTGGSDAKTLAMQADGNLVLYGANGAPLWWTGTGGSGATALVMDQDGSLTIERGTTPLWATWPLADMTVGIDPGHNGLNYSDPSFINQPVWNGQEYESCDTTGTQTASGYTEAQFNFNVATYLAADLRAEGADVVLTRTSNDGVGPCVTTRAQIINNAHANVAVDIHADGGPVDGRGFAVLEPVADGPNDGVIGSSDAFAQDVVNIFAAVTGMPTSTYDGVGGLQPRNNLAGLNLTQVPKILIECGNMQNPTDASILVTPQFQQRAATALAKAITQYLFP